MRIGFTGTQQGMTVWQKEKLEELLKLKCCSEFVMGDCIGADIEAAHIAVKIGVTIFTVYPQDKDTRKRAWFGNPTHATFIEDGHFREVLFDDINFAECQVRWMPAKTPLERNKDIVDNSELLFAAPKEFHHTVRSGTWATIRYAWKKKKDVTVIPPVGDNEDA